MNESEASIARQISIELNRELVSRNGEGITVILDGQCVNLYGFVTTVEHKNHAGDVAQRFPGVSEVKNHISVNLF